MKHASIIVAALAAALARRGRAAPRPRPMRPAVPRPSARRLAARADPGRLRRPHALPVREGHEGPQQLLGRLRRLLAAAAHPRPSRAARGAAKQSLLGVTRRADGTSAGHLRRPPPLSLRAGHQAGPDQRPGPEALRARSGTCSRRPARRSTAATARPRAATDTTATNERRDRVHRHHSVHRHVRDRPHPLVGPLRRRAHRLDLPGIVRRHRRTTRRRGHRDDAERECPRRVGLDRRSARVPRACRAGRRFLCMPTCTPS